MSSAPGAPVITFRTCPRWVSPRGMGQGGDPQGRCDGDTSARDPRNVLAELWVLEHAPASPCRGVTATSHHGHRHQQGWDGYRPLGAPILTPRTTIPRIRRVGSRESSFQCSGGLVGGYWGAWGGWRPSGWRSSLSVRTGTVGSLELPDDDGGGAGLDEAVGTEAPEGDRARRDRGDGADGGPHHVPGEGGVPQAGATAQ